ncbi:ATP-binding protein [Streptomyces sp. NPDC005551]|uniref:ATP-binding protein n=1 Tax=unclassified Streptomyces TaxID=2593676 RepID=UPI003400922E
MTTEPQWDNDLASANMTSLTSTFAGDLRNVTDARLAAEDYLRAFARVSPPGAPEHLDDILLVVTELAANVVQYAPGAFRLELRPTFDGVHVTMHDTSTVRPTPRSFSPDGGGGGIGWHLIQALSDQVSVVRQPDGKDVHVFLPW